jgi:putative tryptophan/tyrosine transport system substrate-binding protein
MQRRSFLTLIGGAAAAWPLAAGAQQAAMPVIGYLQAGSAELDARFVTPFRKGLSEMGYVEGRNLAIEYRYAQNQLERLPELATDLARRRVALIATLGSDAAAQAVKAATATIPIVFEIGGDPVQSRLVASLNRPGGNITGITSMNAELSAKRLGLLHDLLPQAQRFGGFINRGSVTSELIAESLRAAASRIGVQIELFTVSNSSEIDTAFASLVQKRIDAFLGGAGPPFGDRRVQFVSLAARHALPAIYTARDDAAAGGLMSYASIPADRFRQVGLYTGRILKGEKPADLPVMQPAKFEFVINLQTAKLLGLVVPPGLLAIADEVIE